MRLDDALNATIHKIIIKHPSIQNLPQFDNVNDKLSAGTLHCKII